MTIPKWWGRLTSGFQNQERLSIVVDLGGITFSASGNQSYVLTAYVQFLQQLKDGESAMTEAEHVPQLPAFRTKPQGTC